MDIGHDVRAPVQYFHLRCIHICFQVAELDAFEGVELAQIDPSIVQQQQLGVYFFGGVNGKLIGADVVEIKFAQQVPSVVHGSPVLGGVARIQVLVGNPDPCMPDEGTISEAGAIGVHANDPIGDRYAVPRGLGFVIGVVGGEGIETSTKLFFMPKK